ncbi:CRISPR-associated helicase Cas3' [Marinomonas sp. 15G1-11]|uniref:CRISPR-associated helicase Cas3 n=1 Tax=Marinomonas phaeophyticola TaxID=3004091 RepID=A0ABT4JSW3_9GAMM|nr:CRISPR-associated helicase Cas3' [Marinomonas sp. 15G1-11]MCZ2721464.1 CRISPR-associated helicase Cas3' [Marinomonas sp. 15G1-11]
MELASYFLYWGKAQKNELESKGDPYHLLPYHSLDVAAVGARLLGPETELAKNIAEFLGLEPQDLTTLFAFFLALHDLGKFSSAFQALFKDELGYLFAANPNRQYDGREFRHDRLGLYFWNTIRDCDELYSRALNIDEEVECSQTLMVFMNCVLGHHGKPINTDNLRALTPYIERKQNIFAAEQFALDAFHLIQPRLPIEKLVDRGWRQRLKQVSWTLAGVAVLADWVGSDQTYFHYCSTPMGLDQYWPIAQQRAKQALNATDLSEHYEKSPFESIEKHFGFTPTPLQQWAQDVEIDDSPQLFILEDVTGAGKTEAALALTHRLLAANAADGFYFGLPTMATSNAMYKRVFDSYQMMFKADEVKPSIVLAHGAREMNELFQSSLLSSSKDDSDYSSSDQTATAQCNQWLSDSRKKALLAPVGVGTIDQALLAVLPRRHQSLRLLGLHRKVLVFDEVHAADEYMFELLESLLSLHLHQGGSAILLTATLSMEQRQRLAHIYLKESGLKESQYSHLIPTNYHFPLATKVSLTSEIPLMEHELESRADVSRFVEVAYLESEEAVFSKVLESVEKGEIVVWIRNSVDDALKAYQAIHSRMANPENALLFHSRFMLDDRQLIEKQVLACFGKDSNAKDRVGKVLIATQVFQESLDADADVMISDICPIDDLIQRAGRLHRHTRNEHRTYQSGITDTRPSPVLYLHAPVWSDEPAVDWLSQDFINTQYVYRSPGRLWLGMKKLKELGGIKMPEQVRDLIEAVYSSAAFDQIPKTLLKLEQDTQGDELAKANKAKSNRLKWQDYGYSDHSNQYWFDDDSDISTRHSDIETVNVLLLKRNGDGQLEPRVSHPKFAVQLSTLKISKNKYAAKLTQLSEDEGDDLAQRYPSSKYLQSWLPEGDTEFEYNNRFGFKETNNKDML